MARSIYLGADGKLCIKQVTGAREPQKSQALVSVSHSGVNLCDLNFFHVGPNYYITGFEFASTVGVAAIQLAKAAGFGHIFATASPKNHAALQKLGGPRAVSATRARSRPRISAPRRRRSGSCWPPPSTPSATDFAGPGVDPRRTSPALVASQPVSGRPWRVSLKARVHAARPQ
ncbi:hypothetical protein CSHISOI_07355 [Colletotrichum shisoi]|uniref:Uncharacterized protein n=1 Tax=Colletotrichum shisoi TaxID=2078593 RepID=A0A5Q4BM68_9PEZI|nr:hypothetical protein CSHISOI_07355 [Colletotrichum shisoi]